MGRDVIEIGILECDRANFLQIGDYLADGDAGVNFRFSEVLHIGTVAVTVEISHDMYTVWPVDSRAGTETPIISRNFGYTFAHRHCHIRMVLPPFIIGPRVDTAYAPGKRGDASSSHRIRHRFVRGSSLTEEVTVTGSIYYNLSKHGLTALLTFKEDTLADIALHYGTCTPTVVQDAYGVLVFH